MSLSCFLALLTKLMGHKWIINECWSRRDWENRLHISSHTVSCLNIWSKESVRHVRITFQSLLFFINNFKTKIMTLEFTAHCLLFSSIPHPTAVSCWAAPLPWTPIIPLSVSQPAVGTDGARVMPSDLGPLPWAPENCHVLRRSVSQPTTPA